MEETIRGIAAACEKLGTPVISGNVSLYNETNGEPVLPTPVIGMLGLLEDVEKHCLMGFQRRRRRGLPPRGDARRARRSAGRQRVSCARCTDSSPGGRGSTSTWSRAFSGSAWKRFARPPAFGARLLAGRAGRRAGGELHRRRPRHEAATERDVGRLDAALFGEAQSRIVVSCAPERSGRTGGAGPGARRAADPPRTRRRRAADAGRALVDVRCRRTGDAPTATGLPRALAGRLGPPLSALTAYPSCLILFQSNVCTLMAFCG